MTDVNPAPALDGQLVSVHAISRPEKEALGALAMEIPLIHHGP